MSKEILITIPFLLNEKFKKEEKKIVDLEEISEQKLFSECLFAIDSFLFSLVLDQNT